MMNKNNIYVTSPSLPDFNEFVEMAAEIWNTHVLTNNGPMALRFERELSEWLGVDNISLYANGTLPIMGAIHALGLKGEIITTPYTFVATANAIVNSGCIPVFADVEPGGVNLDAEAAEKMINERTVAIMPVHCYGIPCRVDKFEKLGDRYGLPVIYDAAHAFGVRINGRSLLSYGTCSSTSFHATKVFNTFEGGALVCCNSDLKILADRYRNFGFTGEISVEDTGINCKMDELRAAVGILNLRNMERNLSLRRNIADRYEEAIASIDGLYVIKPASDVEWNYSHFPIMVNEKVYGSNRDTLYSKMKSAGVFGRRYFYPLVTEFMPYRDSGLRCGNLDNARKVSGNVICLPLYPDMTESDVNRVWQQLI